MYTSRLCINTRLGFNVMQYIGKSLVLELVRPEYLEESRMKTFVLVACVLAIASTAYSFDPKASAEFHENFKKCSEEVGVPQEVAISNVEVIKCTAVKEGTIINAQGIMKKERVLEKFEDLISDLGKLNQAKQIFISCSDKVDEIGSDKINEVVQCSLPLVLFFD